MTARGRTLGGIAAMLTGLSMVVTRLASFAGPATWDPAAVDRWFARHGESFVSIRALTVAGGAIALVAFAASFREVTWALVPQQIWTGTIMVLAALGYAVLASVAAAVDLTMLRALRVGAAAAETVSIGAFAQQALLILATPALIVVMLAATIPLLRWGRGSQATAVLAVATALLLAIPDTHHLGRAVAGGWFMLMGVVMFWPRPDLAPDAPVRPARAGGSWRRGQ